jgi:Domain of unknown function (DUF4349)
MSRRGLWVMAVLAAACSRSIPQGETASDSAATPAGTDAAASAPAEQSFVTSGLQAAQGVRAMKAALVAPASQGAAGSAANAAPAPIDRMIVRSAQMTLQVSDVRKASAEVADAAASVKGFVGNSRMWRDGDADLASLTIRVPSSSLDATLARLRKLAVRVDNEALTGEDVTRQAVDLTAQLTNLRATEAELRALLTTVRLRAKRASDVLEVHAELSRIRGEIDQHTAELQSLTQLAALSTISLELRPDVVATPIATDAWQPRGVLRDALRALAGTGRIAVNGVIWGVVYAAPLILLAGGLLLVLRQVWMRTRSAVRTVPAP